MAGLVPAIHAFAHFVMAGLVPAIHAFFVVIAGLDPAIHAEAHPALTVLMDARAGKLAQPA
jgi:hypothetical protein